MELECSYFAQEIVVLSEKSLKRGAGRGGGDCSASAGFAANWSLGFFLSLTYKRTLPHNRTWGILSLVQLPDKQCH